MFLISLILLAVTGTTFCIYKNILYLKSGIAAFLSYIILTSVIYFTGQSLYTQDTEYLGYFGKSAEYYEDWDEKVSCRHPTYCTRTVSDGKTTRTETYQCGYDHLYDVDYHPEYFVLNYSDESIYISKQEFFDLASRWNNKIFKELNRRYHSKDGNCYITNYDNIREHIRDITIEQSYENRTLLNTSLFNYPDYSPEELKTLKLYDYKSVNNYQQNGIYDVNNEFNDLYVRAFNALYGEKKQIRLNILLYRNRDVVVSSQQERYWKGGNKNEFNVCIGLDNTNKIRWVRVFSWYKGVLCKETEDFILSGNQIKIKETVDFIESNISKFERKHFKEFAYITFEIPFWMYILSTIFIIAGSLAIIFTERILDYVQNYR